MDNELLVLTILVAGVSTLSFLEPVLRELRLSLVNRARSWRERKPKKLPPKVRVENLDLPSPSSQLQRLSTRNDILDKKETKEKRHT